MALWQCAQYFLHWWASNSWFSCRILQALQDQLIEHLSLFQQKSITTDQITLSELPPKDVMEYRGSGGVFLHWSILQCLKLFCISPPISVYLLVILLLSITSASKCCTFDSFIINSHLCLWPFTTRTANTCKHIHTPYELIQRGFTKPDDVTDLLNALFQFMVAISPIKAKPIYIQLPGGDKTMLIQAWWVSLSNSISSISSWFVPSLRLRCMTTGMKQLFHHFCARCPIASFPLLTGHQMLLLFQSILFLQSLHSIYLSPTTSLHGASMIL